MLLNVNKLECIILEHNFSLHQLALKNEQINSFKFKMFIQIDFVNTLKGYTVLFNVIYVSNNCL